MSRALIESALNRYRPRGLYALWPSWSAKTPSERFTEEVIYGQDEKTSALSSYFELMDRLLPNFLSILSPQTFRGTRILLK